MKRVILVAPIVLTCPDLFNPMVTIVKPESNGPQLNRKKGKQKKYPRR